MKTYHCIATLLITIGFLFNSPVIASETNTGDSIASKFEHLEYNWYFPLYAKKAYIEKYGTEYYLVLNYMNYDIYAFADRPHQNAHKYNLDLFINEWSNIFETEPPYGHFSAESHIGDTVVPFFDEFILANPKIINKNTMAFYIIPRSHQTLMKNQTFYEIKLVIVENWDEIHHQFKHVVPEDEAK